MIIFSLINVEMSHEEDVISQIKDILSRVDDLDFEIQGVFGNYDVIVKTQSKNETSVSESISRLKKINRLENLETVQVNNS